MTCITPPPPYYSHPREKFLYMHYCIRQEDRKQFFLNQHLDKLKVEISEEDRELEDKSGFSAAKITILRKGVEECIVQTLYTLDEDIVRSRQELRRQMMHTNWILGVCSGREQWTSTRHASRVIWQRGIKSGGRSCTVNTNRLLKRKQIHLSTGGMAFE